MNKTFLIAAMAIFLIGIVSAEANKVYILNLNYDNGKITLKDKIVKYGYSPDRKIQPEEGYRAEVASATGDVLYFFNFEVPSKIYVDVTEPGTNELSGGIIKLDKTDFALVIPYFEEAKEIRFYDINNNMVLSVDAEERLSGKRNVLLWLMPIVFAVIVLFLMLIYRKIRKV